MSKRALRIVSLLATALVVTGCSGFFGSWFGPQREAWRSEAESRCLASGQVRVTAYVQAMTEYDGPGACGADRPFRVSAFGDGAVGVRPTASLNCPMTAALDTWIQQVVQPQAMATVGQPVTEIKVLASYGCRRINGRAYGSMSEHAYMNALDVGSFVFADGSEASVLKGYRANGSPAQAFLQGVGAESCSIFNTVIGPDGDAQHQDHFHLDLAQRRSGKYCRGAPAGHGGAMSYAAPGFDPTVLLGVHDHGPDDVHDD
ncbi:extensin-like domain-containing protein [Prosthecomicrobium sp. N25]|uniref:extensin-like domain-containing protein n=1 Tax=Prosthecomicrobium sp. N25 TaxID=3129254 RepID=UPI00307848AE